MAPREDETYRATRYGGHPPACTCVECCEKRKAGIRPSGDQVEHGGPAAWFWVVIGIVVVALVLTLVLR